MKSKYYSVVFGLLLPFLLVPSGCRKGPQYPHATVSGVVTLDGKPLKSGSVIVMSPQANVGTEIDSNGGFLLKGVPKGKMRFQIYATEETGEMQKSSLGAEIPVKVNLIPEKYAQGIEKEIEQDVTDMKIELVTK